VGKGEQAALHFNCRLNTGELAASTHGGAALDKTTPKAAIFIPDKDDAPMAIIAGVGLAEESGKGFRSFEEEIGSRLAVKAVAMRPGESRLVTLAEKARPAVGGQGLLSMARVRVRPKEVHISRAEYTARRGSEPEIGASYIVDPLVPGTVTAVKDTDVTVRFTADPGREVKTPFGPAVIRDAGDHYEIAIDPRPGSLTRSGPLVGRIVKIDERSFTIDYNHPFGGEELRCEVLMAPLAARTAGSEKR
jgi:hypothetical protein